MKTVEICFIVPDRDLTIDHIDEVIVAKDTITLRKKNKAGGLANPRGPTETGALLHRKGEIGTNAHRRGTNAMTFATYCARRGPKSFLQAMKRRRERRTAIERKAVRSFAETKMKRYPHKDWQTCTCDRCEQYRLHRVRRAARVRWLKP